MRVFVTLAALLFLCAACLGKPAAPTVAVAGTPLPDHTLAPAVTPAPTPSPAPTTPPTASPTATPTPTEPPDVTTNAAEEDGLQPEPIVWPEGLRDPYPSEYKTAPAGEDLTLSNNKTGWYYNRNAEHQPPTAQNVFDIRPFSAYYLGDITQKIVYLTFDEGYENGFTGEILDILLEKEVPAAFFMTKTYIRDNPELAVRIAAEGHVAANHSVRHISFPDLTDEEIAYELTETAGYFKEITGYEMAPFVRPPSGEYSVRTLAQTQACGYDTVFWSFAHMDWLRDDQPGREVTFKRVMDNLHNGGILLLHAVSESNTQALPGIIDAIRAEGYTFGDLWELKN